MSFMSEDRIPTVHFDLHSEAGVLLGKYGSKQAAHAAAEELGLTKYTVSGQSFDTAKEVTQEPTRCRKRYNPKYEVKYWDGTNHREILDWVSVAYERNDIYVGFRNTCCKLEYMEHDNTFHFTQGMDGTVLQPYVFFVKQTMVGIGGQILGKPIILAMDPQGFYENFEEDTPRVLVTGVAIRDTDKCSRCNVSLVPGMAIMPRNNEGVRTPVQESGLTTADLIPCKKCPECGESHTLS